MKRRLFQLAAVLLITGCSVDTANTSYHYVPPAAVSPEQLTQPATNDSKAGLREEREILAFQHHASKSEIDKAVVEQQVEPELMTVVLGPDFTRTRYPATYQLLDNTKEDVGAMIGQAKRYWHTTRPYMADSRVKPLVPNANTDGSYPSGHATISRVWAEVLGELVPQKKAALRARADEIAQHRVLAGMHYPRDIEGGKKLALMFLADVKKTPGYQQDLQKAKEELQH